MPSVVRQKGGLYGATPMPSPNPRVAVLTIDSPGPTHCAYQKILQLGTDSVPSPSSGGHGGVANGCAAGSGSAQGTVTHAPTHRPAATDLELPLRPYSLQPLQHSKLSLERSKSASLQDSRGPLRAPHAGPTHAAKVAARSLVQHAGGRSTVHSTQACGSKHVYGHPGQPEFCQRSPPRFARAHHEPPRPTAQPRHRPVHRTLLHPRHALLAATQRSIQAVVSPRAADLPLLLLLLVLLLLLQQQLLHPIFEPCLPPSTVQASALSPLISLAPPPHDPPPAPTCTPLHVALIPPPSHAYPPRLRHLRLPRRPSLPGPCGLAPP